jgi:ribosomal protein L10
MKNEMIAKVLKEYRKNNNLSVREVAGILENKSINVAEKTIYG